MKKLPVTANKGFTLLEIVVGLAILLIIASIAVVAYSKHIDHSREAVCEKNLKTLRNAVQVYVSETAALPATLGDLKRHHLEQGHEIALENADWKTKLAYWVEEFNLTPEAQAFTLKYDDLKEYGASEAIFRCPVDPNGGASYAINEVVAGKAWTDLGNDVVLIAESDSYTFIDAHELQSRHGRPKMALAITMNGTIIKLDPQSDVVNGGDDEVTICHKGKTTKTKSGSALEAHLAHGDTLGACP
jgi:prepilin-type N-terminal cleavage/methylation domain-containing protein